MEDLSNSSQKEVKKFGGRRPIDPQGQTKHVGYRSSEMQKNHLIDVACDLGYRNVSDLIRHIVQGWLTTYEKTNGARKTHTPER
jgi:hypothetical protein